MLFHNLSQEPFENDEAKKTTQELGLAPEPVSEGEDTVAEDESETDVD